MYKSETFTVYSTLCTYSTQYYIPTYLYSVGTRHKPKKYKFSLTTSVIPTYTILIQCTYPARILNKERRGVQS